MLPARGDGKAISAGRFAKQIMSNGDEQSFMCSRIPGINVFSVVANLARNKTGIMIVVPVFVYLSSSFNMPYLLLSGQRQTSPLNTT